VALGMCLTNPADGANNGPHRTGDRTSAPAAFQRQTLEEVL